MRIPTYSADRNKLRDHSLAKVEQLLEAGRVMVQRNRAGAITACQFLPRPAPKPKPRLSIPTGTYYSHEINVGDGYWLWQHKDLLKISEVDRLMGERVEDLADAQLFIQATFFAVPLSILRITDKPPAILRNAIEVSVGPKKSAELAQQWKRSKRRVKSGKAANSHLNNAR